MVTLLPQVQRGSNAGSFGAHIGKEFAEGMNTAQKQQNEFAKMAKQSQLRKDEQAQKLGLDQETEARDYKTIKENFGDRAANIYRALPTGGKTKFSDFLFKSALRHETLEDIFSGRDEGIADEEGDFEPQHQSLEDMYNQEQGDNSGQQQAFKKTAQVTLESPNLPKGYKYPEFNRRPKGTTPKEWKEDKRLWRKENDPIVKETSDKIRNQKKDMLGVRNLTRLNETKKVAEGFERALINPETGEFYGIAQLAKIVSPEAQEWVKEIARFQNRAKDAFGARVTNFDLQSYMKQFPGLMNTYEGRKRILEMIEINYQLDNLYDQTLEKVFQKYGSDGIPFTKANQVTQDLIKGETERLQDKYLMLDQENQNNPQDRFSGTRVDVIGPDGELYEIDESELSSLPEGFKRK